MTDLPIAYEGKDPYIFISYPHADMDKVVPVISALQSWGFRVWYDAGIEAGTEWPAYIGAHIKNASCVLIFMSEAAANSSHCRREITLAESNNKNMLTVYFKEGLKLDEGLELQLCMTQAMFMSRFPSLDAFVSRLIGSEVLRPCCAYPDRLPSRQQAFSEPPVPPVQSQPTYVPPAYAQPAYTPPPQASGFDAKKLAIPIAVGVAVIALVVVVILLLGGNGGQSGENVSSGSASSSLAGVESVHIPEDKKEDKYNEALDLISNGSYYDAYVILSNLGDFSDSQAKLAEIREKALVQKISTAEVGDKVYFGAYEQDNKKNNGKEEIEWIVLQQEDGKTLLLSSVALDSKQYHKTETDISWKDCNLRAWLNDTFYPAAFSESEKEYVLQSELETFGSDNTQDHVFLISYKELQTFERLYPEMDFTTIEMTQYSIAQGGGSNTLGGWWMRGAWDLYGYVTADYAMVCRDGGAGSDENGSAMNVDEEGFLIRPSIWVDTSSLS